MRTTLNIDDNVLNAARNLAVRQRKSLGEILSALARQSLRQELPKSQTRNGIPLLPLKQDASPVTPELVNQLRDEIP